MKKFFLSALAIATIGFATSCSDDDDNNPVDPTDPGEPSGEEIVKSGILTEDETWTADNIYILDGKVVVDEGLTLTIEPGTIIKAEDGLETLASALVVDQGGMLMAEGTASNPIIFTSVLDEIEVGQTESPNLTTNDTGLWGGVIILGNAPISVTGDAQTAQIEGIPPTESYGQYGGSNPSDNSGVIEFISIRHGGITIGQDNEINGLTMGGVGNGTTIENVEVVANQDDGFEWFGGTVNASNLITWAHGDDGFDADQAYSGTISNGLVIQTNASGSAFELDGPEGGVATEDSFTIRNTTIMQNGSSSYIADLRDGLLTQLNNIMVYGLSNSSTVNINGADSETEYLDGRISFDNWEVVLHSSMNDANDLIEGAPEGSEALFTDNVSIIDAMEDATVGADISVFSWTMAAANDAF